MGPEGFELTISSPGYRSQVFAALAAQPWVQVTGPEVPIPLLIRLGQVEGRLVCTGLVIGDAELDAPEVTARALRAIRLPDILGFLESVRAGREDALPGERESIREFYAAWIGHTLDDSLPTPRYRVRPGPRGLPREHFEAVADAYRRMLVEHRTMKELATEWHASESTMRRWIRRARDMGLLGASIPGKAGELPGGEA